MTTPSTVSTVGFIGLGNIGQPMAAQLANSDFTTYVYDVYPPSVEAVVAQGARPAASPAEMAPLCDVIGLCVRDDNDVEAVLMGPQGLLANMRPGAVVAIHSTVTQDGLARWLDAARQAGIHLIDAPITGGGQGAREKKLCYMVGGPAEIVEHCRPVFMTSGEKLVHAGEHVGAGMALKLCNNLMTYAAFAAVHEATRLAERCGLAPELLFEVGKSNGVVTPQMVAFIGNRQALQSNYSEADFEKLFSPHAMLGEKDLGAALLSASQRGARLPVTERVKEYIKAIFLNKY